MKKALKIIGFVVVVLLLLLFGAQWWLSSKIRKTLEEKVYEQTQGALHVEVGNVSVRLIGRTVRLKDVTVTTDTTRPMEDMDPLKLVDAHIKELTLKGIHFDKQDSVVNIRLRKLSLQISEIQAVSRKISASGKAGAKKMQSLSGKMGVFSAHLDVKDAEVWLGEATYRQIDGGDTVTYVLRDFHSSMDDGRMTLGGGTSLPQGRCEDMQVSFAAFRNRFARQSQSLEVDSLSLAGKAGKLSVAAIRLIPLYDKADFARLAPSHADWTKIETGRVVCNGFDMQKMMSDRLVKIDSVAIERAEISSFKNRQIEQPKKVKRLFYESVQQLPVPLAVGSIRLNDIQVEYQELSKNGVSPGTVTFRNLEGVFSGLTNVASEGHPYYTLKAEGLLMGQGRLAATFLLPVDSVNAHFEVEGRLGKMDLQALNRMVEPLVKVKITSGEVETMDFKISGNDRDAHVNMLFLYKDLKVRLLKEEDGEWKVRSFLTNLVNGIVLKENNPDYGQTRRAEGKAERDVYRSQFNYLWKCLLAGLKESVGL